MSQVEREQLELELHILEGIFVGMSRREEVFTAVENAADMNDALDRLMALLGLDEICCRAILDTQVRRWTRETRRAIEDRMENLRATLAADGSS
jgi:DNA gyrase/topoisomerase IV subunit A